MKTKAWHIVRKPVFWAYMACLFCFFTACGLDVYYVLPAPSETDHVPVYAYNFDESYFAFRTREDFDNTGGVILSGTEVYYKIYSNYSTMTTQVEVLQSLASNDTSSATAATRLINDTSSSGYGYKPLRARNYNSVSSLIPFDGENKKVYIRLSDYLDLTEYSARILVNDEPLYGVSSPTVPMRYGSAQDSFNFGRSGTYDAVPKSTDDDVNYTSKSDGNKWYVAMFAVAVGYDVTYTPYYSNILYLGAVTIDADSVDN